MATETKLFKDRHCEADKSKPTYKRLEIIRRVG